MLDSRYLYLHEALGLGPMWLSQAAYVITAPNESTNLVQTDNISQSDQQNRIKQHALQTNAQTSATLTASSSSDKVKIDNHLSAIHTILADSAKPFSASAEFTAPIPAVPKNQPANKSESFSEFTVHYDDIPASIVACTRCSLHQERCAPLAGHGNVKARLMVITPNPAPQDDSSQHLFSGEVGQLLNNMLAAINISADEVFYTSQVKCTPNISLRITTEQIQACLPALHAQIEYIQPQAILLLGQVFKQLEKEKSLSRYLHDIPYVITPHPARLLRQSHLKASAWSALKILHNYLQ